LKQFLDRAFPQTDQLFNEGPLNMIHVAANISKPSEEGKVISSNSNLDKYPILDFFF